MIKILIENNIIFNILQTKMKFCINVTSIKIYLIKEMISNKIFLFLEIVNLNDPGFSQSIESKKSAAFSGENLAPTLNMHAPTSLTRP